MTYTHHFILQSIYQNGLVVRDTCNSRGDRTALTIDIKEVEEHWTEQNGVPMICVNVYVTEDV